MGKSIHVTALYRIILSVSIALWIAAPRVAAQEAMVRMGPRPDGLGDRPRLRAITPNNASSTKFDTGNNIEYWGGPVLLGTIPVYFIWYGTWDSGSMGLLTSFMSSIGGSPYFNINTGYFDAQGNSVSNSVNLVGTTQNNYSLGKNLGTSSIWQIVSKTLDNGTFPLDSNAVYFVLTAGDVAVSGFGSSFCGYHSEQTYNSTKVHFAFVGNPAPAELNGCAEQQTVSPNGNPGADAMVSTMAHELEESVTDPDLDAWYDTSGEEIADKCAWTYGTQYQVQNKSWANMNLGGHDYLIQQDWINASGGHCGLSASPGPDFALWATANSQSAGAGSSTGNYTVTVIPVKGFSSPIDFSLSGLPAGASVGNIPSSTTGATFTVTLAPTVPGGTYTLTILGTSGSISHPASLTLQVSGQTVLPVGSLADLTSGSGWETTFTLLNLGPASSAMSLSLFGDSGGALDLPFTYPQGTGVPLNASSINQTIGANSMLLLDTSGALNQPFNVGWGDLSAAGNMNAFEIFRYGPSGQEAAVPMETRTGSFALLFDNTSLVNTLGTGVALANLGAQAANIPITISDDTGAQITNGLIPLAAHGHTTFTLADQYPGTAGKRGTVQFAAPPSGQISVLGIRSNGNSFTTIPAIQSGPLGGSMAHIAAGGGWRSIFYVVNLNSKLSNITLSFFDDSGNPLSLPLTFLETGATLTTAVVTQTLAAGAVLGIETQGTGTQVTLGSAQLTSDVGASGFALFRYDPSGQEATAPLETRNAGAYVLAYDNTAPLAMGVALANLSNQAATINVILRNDTGATLQTTTLQLPADGHSAFVLGSNFPLSAGKRGTVEFDSANAQISVLGIRANGNAFTSIPVLTR